ncbi:AAA family ATPase [Flavobacterium sp. JAS]|uniref:AAA family ATPase n=1 Tax=Flavobacterium sp. JAS TaxID=2897329 RepID=UPI00351D89BF
MVLFDKIEKAHCDIQNPFLQIMGKWKLHDQLATEYDFSNSIILCNLNISPDYFLY